MSNKITIINGSPRYKKSNSALLMDHFIEGLQSVKQIEVDVHYLTTSVYREKAVKAYGESNKVIVIFPLYTDAMPGIVKEFFEMILNLPPDASKKVGFVVQSGFPETSQSDHIEQYLDKFATQRLNCQYVGTVVKGGVEGIQIMPERMTKKLFNGFSDLGTYYAQHTAFDPIIVAQFRKPYQLSKGRKRLFTVLSRFGITNFYWNSRLKQNNAYERRFDAPYGASAER